MRIRAVDLFCGAGGLSRGIMDACAARRHKLDLIAVNHWDTAINSHSLNHPTVRHICEPVENLWPARVIPGRHLNLLAAGVECTFHSNARGGGPCKEQSRSQAWQLIRWLSDITVDNLLVENVREFLKWGPLYPCTCGSKSQDPNKHRKGFKCLRPIPERAGEFFEAWVSAVRALGYRVEWRIQCAADYGDPTSRERLLIIARRENAEIKWPSQTHYDPDILAEMPRSRRSRLKPWRTARECIDWALEGQSIFNRRKPLCQNTIRRIIAGLRKFGGPNAEPFITILNGTSRSHINSSAQSVDEPLGTVTGANRFCLVDGRIEPFITHLTHHGGDDRRCHSLDAPLPTVTGARRGEMAFIEPAILKITCNCGREFTGRLDEPCPKCGQIQSGYTNMEPFILPHLRTKKGKDVAPAASTKKPFKTITGQSNDFRLVEPFITHYHSGKRKKQNRNSSVNTPLPTQDTSNRFALVQPFILPREGYFRGNTAKPIDDPMVTVTSNGVGQLIEPILVQTDQTGGNGSYSRSLKRPLGTIVSKQNLLLVEPMIMKFYGTGIVKSTREPLDTVTTKDRFMLVECGTRRPVAELDIRTRMLQPHELAAAHSFPKRFIFTGTKEDQTKQIGNSVPKELACAHVKVLLP